MANLTVSKPELAPNVVMHDLVDSLSTGLSILNLNLLSREMPADLKTDLQEVVGCMKKIAQDLERLAYFLED